MAKKRKTSGKKISSSKKKTPAKKKTTKRKTSTRKKTTKRKNPSIKINNNVEKVLVENFVSLQRVMTNLSFKFENLSSQISKLLELFEISARTIAEKELESEKNPEENKQIIEKIETLLEQNKVIARGMTLMHKVLTSHHEESPLKMTPQPQIPSPPSPTTLQTRQMPSQQIKKPIMNTGEYQKSISSSQENHFEKIPKPSSKENQEA
jgi:hypothetical protein